MEENKKEHLALATGFVLILFVLAFTLFRYDKSPDKNLDPKTVSGPSSKSQQKFNTISPNDLQKKISLKSNNIAMLDVRSFEAYIEEHIIDSIGIPLDEFPVEQKIDGRSQIIVIGQSANDENIGTAVEKLKGEKFKDILVLAGGIDAWKQSLSGTVSYGNPKSFVDQSKVSYLDPEQLNDALKAEVPLFIVDVRSKAEFSKGHIKGALNIPFDELEKRRGEITERKAVVVGANELEEFQASVQLYDMLLISPFVMRTAMPGWESKGFPLTQ
ncbi:MAG: sulfur transferase, selenocysteine-containing [uncultured bacterium]|nr:MAG: sulfur transferase, selenocysteine-containing [uncultured bacterium]